MINLKDFITGWNNAGEALNADLLNCVFKPLETPGDIAIHNFMMHQVSARIGKYQKEFSTAVANIIAELSLRNLHDAKEKEISTTG